MARIPATADGGCLMRDPALGPAVGELNMPDTATMDFFQHQEAAKRKTSILVIYYFLAVLMIILGVYVAFVAIFTGFNLYQGGEFDPAKLWRPQAFLYVAGITGVLVVVGTLFKIIQLSRGGESVAVMLGGRPIEPGSADPNERRVLNVVEEMAIASGMPVPKVFILDEEPGINAFAAGFSPRDAVIGITAGGVRALSRDELQGVIGHEFSHILNGDMRLNIRLLGVLNGILVVAVIGFHMFRMAARGSTRSRKGGGALPVILFGLVVMAIGYIGVFFGRLIKSAVSRQREFLADAAAMQFTRNPDGLVGALRKIAGVTRGSSIRHESAEPLSHFFFADGLARGMIGLFSTHPPIDERIRRLAPETAGREPGLGVRASAALGGGPGALASFAGAGRGFAVDPERIVASVGAPQAEHLAYVGALMQALPAGLVDSARDPGRASVVVYALLLSGDAGVRDIQLRGLPGEARVAVSGMAEAVSRLAQEHRLPLLDIAVSTLRHMAAEGYEDFRRTVQAIVAADSAVDLFEFAMERMIVRNLDPVFGQGRRRVTEYHDIRPVLGECGALLSCLAYWGSETAAGARRAFETGAAKLEAGEPVPMEKVEGCGLDRVDRSLERLARGAPTIRRRVLDACITCVVADRMVTVEEAQLVRIVADALDCPVPPLLPGHSPGGGEP